MIMKGVVVMNISSLDYKGFCPSNGLCDKILMKMRRRLFIKGSPFGICNVLHAWEEARIVHTNGLALVLT